MGQRTSGSGDNSNMADVLCLEMYLYYTPAYLRNMLHRWLRIQYILSLCLRITVHALTHICDLTAEERFVNEDPLWETLWTLSLLFSCMLAYSLRQWVSLANRLSPTVQWQDRSQQPRPIRDQGCRSSRVLRRIIWMVQGFPRHGNETIGQDCPLCLSLVLHNYSNANTIQSEYISVSSKDDEIQERNIHGNKITN